MSDEEFDSWETGSGLIESIDRGTIKDAYVKYDDEYRDGEIPLVYFVIQSDDPEDGDGGEVETRYGTGPGWEVKDDGARIQREDGKNKKPNENTAYGRLLKATVACAGDTVRNRGDAREMATWKGLTFKWGSQEKTFAGLKDEDTGEPVKNTILIPVELLDAGKGGKGSSKSSSKSSEKADDNGGGSSDELSMPLKIKLKALAKDHESWEQFAEAAFTDSDLNVEGNKAATAAVMDQTDSGIYAQAHAS
jgi:hypothetical protein